MIMLIDMHHLMHRAYYTFKNLSLHDGTPIGMIYGSLNIILSLYNKYEPKDLIICYDGGSQRRKAMSVDYKSNRVVDKSNGFYQQMLILKQILDDFGIKQVCKIQEEADDIIGTLATKLSKKDKIIIVSGDHDFLQLIDDNIMVLREGSNGKLYLKDMIVDEYGVEPKKLIDMHSICGDGCDNIKGISGIGPKKAAKFIIDHNDLDNLISKSIDDEKLSIIKDNKDKLLLNRQLVTIITDLNIDENIRKPEKNMELMKILFEKYFQFNSLLKRWSQIEKFSNIGGEETNNSVQAASSVI